MLKVKVVQVNKGQKNGNFIHKLVSERSVTILGIEKKAKVTYYVSLPTAAPINSEHEIDLNKFIINEYPYEFINDQGEEVRILTKWLSIK